MSLSSKLKGVRRKRVAVLVQSRANYARIKEVLIGLNQSSKVELLLVLGASANLEKFGDLKSVIRKDGLEVSAEFNSIVDGDSPAAMASSTGLTVLNLVTLFDNLKPDLVMTVADRFETLGTAIAASYMNIPVAHTQGGELTGSIDESVRHAITKLSHYHFPATEKSMHRLIQLGEDPAKIYLTGCPSIDLARKVQKKTVSLPNPFPGVGAQIDFRKPYRLVIQHPVTTDFMNTRNQILPTLQAISKLGPGQTIWLWPNVDAGADTFSKEIRRFRESGALEGTRFVRNVAPEEFIQLLVGARVLIGNSSSGIREAAFLGKPTVNIGNRQELRERAGNVMDVGYVADEIYTAIVEQERKGAYDSSLLFGDGDASQRIVKILEADTPFYQKRFFDLVAE
jgi:UDP-hydrolysing UDP-N-acetyl-D-glucosamine 2-epimerase